MGSARRRVAHPADHGRHAARSLGCRAVAGAVPRGIRSDSRRRLTCFDVRKRPAPVGGAWYLVSVMEDAHYEALLARDPRFDGVFFVGVSTTGIYCRPICPARTPARSRCSFYATAAEAEAAGYRA